MTKPRLLPLLLLLLLAPSHGRSQGTVLIGAPCGAAGVSAISTTGVPVVCAGNPQVWTNPTGGGGVVSPVLGANVKLAANGVPGAVGDGKFFIDGVSNAGNNQLTSATATFSASDVTHTVSCIVSPMSVSAAQAINATVASFVNSSTITYSGGNAGVKTGMYCEITNNLDPPAILAAFNACKSTFNAPNSNTSYQAPGCNIYVPAGLYGLSNTLDNLIVSGAEPCVGIIGDGIGKTVFLPTATFTQTGHSGWLINERCNSAYLADFSVEVASNLINIGTANGAIEMASSNGYLRNVAVFDQCVTGGTTYGISLTLGASNVVLDRPFVTNNGTCTGTAGGLLLSAVSEDDVYSPFLSNTQQNLKIQNSVSGSNGAGTRIWGGVIDEGSITSITNSVDVWLNGVTLTGGANCLSIDATSSVWMSGGYCGTFGGNTGSGPTVASGGKLRMTEVSVNGVNGGSYCYNSVAAGGIFDLGGNNCTVSGGATIYKAGSFPLTFPLTTQAVTQLGGQQVVSGIVPTSCTITGNGTSTCAFDTGSTDAAGRITITAAGTTTAVGLVSFNFSTTYGTNSTNCSANYLSGTGTWAIGAIAPIFITNTTAAASFNINNAGTNLTATSTYKVNYTCYGQ